MEKLILEQLMNISGQIGGIEQQIVYLKNEMNYNRYCISVSKKIGKANIRNLYKRRIKDILMKNKVDKSYDCVIILRKAILDINYINIKEELLSILEGIK